MKISVFKTQKKIRLTAILVCIVMILGMLMPATAFAEMEEQIAELGVDRTADASTIADWNDVFKNENGTSQAGRIWTDKTVATEDITVVDGIVEKKNENSFLVGLSALGSTKTTRIKAMKPVDVMLVLDVSGSMVQQGSEKMEQLVDATNQMMRDILEMNDKNRVGVVCFSSAVSVGEGVQEASFCLFPLGRYTTKSDKYILYQKRELQLGILPSIRIDGSVCDESQQVMNPGEANRYVVDGLTYMQSGLLEGLDNFGIHDVSEDSEERIPIVTLVTDGAPTSATVSYTEKGDANVGGEQATDIRMAFLTQLTAAWTKKKLQTIYQTSPLFYTVGIIEEAKPEEATYIREVLNPSEDGDSELISWWNEFLEIEVGTNIKLESKDIPGAITVQKADDLLQKRGPDEKADRYYVDEYFEADSNRLIKSSLEKIVKLIEKASTGLPTEEGETGTLFFEDPVGEYMNVVHMSGIMYDGKLHDGSYFAEKMVSGDNQEDKKAVLEVLPERVIGITAEQASALLDNALNSGQISYTESEKFSNYIAWYANEKGEYIAPYNEAGAVPNGAASLNRSYFYYGESIEAGKDLLQLGVRVEENLTTHEQTVKFSVPPSLLPLIRYDVSTMVEDVNNSTTRKSEAYPVHLFYEVKLEDGINGYDLNGVDPAYQHLKITEDEKAGAFYTNTWRVQEQAAEAGTSVVFTVSDDNEYYHYTKDTPVYQKKETGGFELYTGEKPPADDGGQYYSRENIYNVGKDGGAKVELPIAHTSLEAAKKTGEGWVIPKGTFRYANLQEKLKSEEGNKTGTAGYVSKPVLGSEADTLAVSLGNNGKQTVRQGRIIVSKKVESAAEFAEGDNENTEFHFEIDLKQRPGETMPESIVGETWSNPESKEDTEEVLNEEQRETKEYPVENGIIRFTLKTRENIEIWLPDGEDVSVKEVGDNEARYETEITLNKSGKPSETVKRKEMESVLVEATIKTQVRVKNGLPSLEIPIYKRDMDWKLLGGAEFALYRLNCTDPEHDHKQLIPEGVDENDAGCWVRISTASSSDAEVSKGLLQFEIGGKTDVFPRGTYRFVEVKAPDGYVKPVGQWEMKITPGANKPIIVQSIPGENGEEPPAVTNSEGSVYFHNYKPLDPPITGGRGIWCYLIFGAAVAFGGIRLAVYQIRRKK